MIDTNVIVGDGDVVVLGGLVQDTYTDNKSKVPLLGDIPVVGALFRSENRTKQRRNLLVFLRPVVLRDEAAGTKLTQDRYEQIRNSQLRQQPDQSWIMRHLNEGPVLPELPAEKPPSSQPLSPADTTTPPTRPAVPVPPASAPQ